MPPIQPDQAQFLLQLALRTLKNEHATTRRVIEAIPVDRGDYKPDEVSKTALELAWHIVATERRFLDAVAAGQFDFTPSPMPDSLKNSSDVAAWYGQMFAEKIAPLESLSPDQLTKIVDFRGRFQLPAVMYLQFLGSHSIHHRGQLSTYLRPMGSKVPAIYGESYDSAKAQKA
ncbi:MAG: DinB family protein [Acidobacteriaceae bacterium]|nr:DinB family protein [Acidobacteriaceae bacterium]